VGTGSSLARAEPDQVCEKFPHADFVVSWRKRFSCATESDTRKLECAATHADSESLDRLARRESLDTEGREQSLLVPGTLRLVQKVRRRTRRFENIRHGIQAVKMTRIYKERLMIGIPPTAVGGYFKSFLQPRQPERYSIPPTAVGGLFKPILFINNRRI
jgi:hypothetical protein